MKDKIQVWHTRWLHSEPEEDGEDFAVVKVEDIRQMVEKFETDELEHKDKNVIAFFRDDWNKFKQLTEGKG